MCCFFFLFMLWWIPTSGKPIKYLIFKSRSDGIIMFYFIFNANYSLLLQNVHSKCEMTHAFNNVRRNRTNKKMSKFLKLHCYRIEKAFYLFFRLTPVFAFVIFYYATIFDHTGSGPMWKMVVSPESKDCRNNWYLNLLYISNYVRDDHLVSK